MRVWEKGEDFKTLLSQDEAIKRLATQKENIILNSASNQTINQNTNVTLTIYNLPQWQQQLAQHALSAQLAGEIMAASGLGH